MPSPKRQTDKIAVFLTFTLLYALASFALKLVIHLVYSDFRGDTLYRISAVAGIAADLGIGCLVGALAASFPGRLQTWIFGSAFCGVVLFATGAGAHYHAAHNRLPGRSVWTSIDGRSAFVEHFGAVAPLWMLALEVALFAAAVGILAPRMATSLHYFLRLSRRRSSITLLSTCAVAALVATITGLSLDGQPRFAMTPAIVHSFTQPSITPKISKAPKAPPEPEPVPEPEPTPEPKPVEIEDLSVEELAAIVQQSLAPENMSGVEDKEHPYCRLPSSEPKTAKAPRNVIVVVLEKVGADAALASAGGEPLMPNLARMAEEGIFFDRFFASGNRVDQGLVGMLSGIPPSPMGRLLDRVPIPRLEGLPKTLEEYGFATIFVGGSELSAHQQRHYLRQVGFERIIEPNLTRDVLAEDGSLTNKKTLANFKRVLRNHNKRDKRPYFALIHLTQTGARVAGQHGVSNSEVPGALKETDRALENLHGWYLKNEQPGDTVLIVTSSYAADLFGTRQAAEEENAPLFRVPFLVLGLGDEEKRELPNRVKDRIGGHLDLPQTVLGLLGISATGCYQGRDLLSRGEWPESRRVVSVGGPEAQRVYFHEKGGVTYEIIGDGAEIVTYKAPHEGSEDGFPSEKHVENILTLYRAFFALNSHIDLKDAYAPSLDSQTTPLSAIKTISAADKPVAVSWMGRTSGEPCPSCAPDGSMRAVLNAQRAGFGWVLLELQLSKDEVPVISPEQHFRLRSGKVITTDAFPYRKLEARTLGAITRLKEMLDRYRNTMDFVLNLPATGDEKRDLTLSSQTLRMLRKLAPRQDVILTSADLRMATLLAHHGPVSTAFQMPEAEVEQRWLDYAVLSGFDWVQIHADFVDPEFVRKCHDLGLKILAYGIEKKALNSRFEEAVPDAILVEKTPGWLKKRRRR